MEGIELDQPGEVAEAGLQRMDFLAGPGRPEHQAAERERGEFLVRWRRRRFFRGAGGGEIPAQAAVFFIEEDQVLAVAELAADDGFRERT